MLPVALRLVAFPVFQGRMLNLECWAKEKASALPLLWSPVAFCPFSAALIGGRTTGDVSQTHAGLKASSNQKQRLSRPSPAVDSLVLPPELSELVSPASCTRSSTFDVSLRASAGNLLRR